MKAKRIFSIVAILVFLLVLVPVNMVNAAATKVDVCHLDKDAGVFFLINISDNAFEQHVAHGDAAPGDAVPGMAGWKFALDCSQYEVRPLIDTIVVPSNGSSVVSNVVLESGKSYQFEASGTYKFVDWANAGIADARFSLRIPGSYNNTGAINWIDGAALIPGYPNYLQVWVNNAPFTWGTGYEATHVYTSNFTGSGTVSFKIVDNAYGDNSGVITVKIYQIN